MRFVNKKLRLQNWSYFKGCYHIVICTKNRVDYFGEVRKNEMYLSRMGVVALNFLKRISDHFKNVILDVFVIMPDHVHLILHLTPQTVDYKLGFDPVGVSNVGVAYMPHLQRNKSNAPLSTIIQTRTYILKNPEIE